MENIHLEFIELSDESNQTKPNCVEELLSSFYSDNEDEDLLDCMNILTNSMDEYDTYTIKQLLRIHDYYNIPKPKSKSKKKDIIVSEIVAFESDVSNMKVVVKRKKLWAYMRELKEDKHMKQYLFWD